MAVDSDGMQTSSSMEDMCRYRRTNMRRNEYNMLFMLSVFMFMEAIPLNLCMHATVLCSVPWALLRKSVISNGACDISKRQTDANSKGVIVNV